MSFCASDCANFDLVENPTGGCEPLTRTRTINKIGFWLCTTDIPDPLTCAALETMIGDQSIVFTSPLVNAEWGDPTFEELQVADCMSGIRRVTSRILTFQDRLAVTFPAVTSPSTAANPFGDYAFWANKQSATFRLRYGVLYCDGAFEVLKDANGLPMIGSFDIFRSQERQGSGANSYVLEIKKGQIEFKGDPLQFVAPELDTSTCDFNI